MASDPSNQDEWTVHALNIHGVFFERRCVEAVAGVSDWQVVSTNYPVEYPPPNGPWRGKESSLDIRARKLLPDSQILDIQIECKKANPEFVNWIFFPKRSSSGTTIRQSPAADRGQREPTCKQAMLRCQSRATAERCVVTT
jgi:hypothetical protein